MTALTDMQSRILQFIQERLKSTSLAPSVREIAAHFGFRSPRAAACHVQALERKGFISHEPGKARSWRLRAPLAPSRPQIMDVPLYGNIPAGFPGPREQEAEGCVSIDIKTVGLHPTARTFALRVKGDSMIGRHILDGDIVVLEHGLTPQEGSVVAALIDNESTLKTFVLNRGKPCLRAENPKYPQLIPAAELVIQGVMVALIRKCER